MSRHLLVTVLVLASCATWGPGAHPRSVGRASYQQGGDDAHEKRRYTFELFEDGTLSFDGVECVPLHGRQLKTITDGRFDDVARLFQQECAQLAVQDSPCDRGDVIRLTCSGGAEKFEQTSCDGAVPARSAEELLDKLITAADLREWVGPRERGCKAR